MAIQFLRGTTAQVSAATTSRQEGQPAFDTATGMLSIKAPTTTNYPSIMRYPSLEPATYPLTVQDEASAIIVSAVEVGLEESESYPTVTSPITDVTYTYTGSIPEGACAIQLFSIPVSDIEFNSSLSTLYFAPEVGSGGFDAGDIILYEFCRMAPDGFHDYNLVVTQSTSSNYEVLQYGYGKRWSLSRPLNSGACCFSTTQNTRDTYQASTATTRPVYITQIRDVDSPTLIYPTEPQLLAINNGQLIPTQVATFNDYGGVDIKLKAATESVESVDLVSGGVRIGDMTVSWPSGLYSNTRFATGLDIVDAINTARPTTHTVDASSITFRWMAQNGRKALLVGSLSAFSSSAPKVGDVVKFTILNPITNLSEQSYITITEVSSASATGYGGFSELGHVKVVFSLGSTVSIIQIFPLSARFAYEVTLYYRPSTTSSCRQGVKFKVVVPEGTVLDTVLAFSNFLSDNKRYFELGRRFPIIGFSFPLTPDSSPLTMAGSNYIVESVSISQGDQTKLVFGCLNSTDTVEISAIETDTQLAPTWSISSSYSFGQTQDLQALLEI